MSRRTIQVAELLAQVISEIIISELSDPRISGLVTITGAEVSPDLRIAKVYFSVLGSESDWESTTIALNKASGFIQRIVAQRIVLKVMPRIKFIPDHTAERAQRIESILEKIEPE